MIYFEVHGQPIPKARPRICKRHVYTPEKTISYEKVIALECKKSMEGSPPIRGAVRIITDIYIKIPKSWSKKKKLRATSEEIRPTSRPDFDNYLKSICDACNGIAYIDDSQIVDFSGALWYSEEPKVCIWIYPI